MKWVVALSGGPLADGPPEQSFSGNRDYGLPWPLAFGPALSE
jgi:hypothetical protein